MNSSIRIAAIAAILVAALTLAAPVADAKTLRWAGRGDMQTTDPHSQNENLTNNINQLVYEFLFVRDKNLRPDPGARRPSGSRSTRRRGASSCAKASSSTTGRRSLPTMSCSASSVRAPTLRSSASTPTRRASRRRSTISRSSSRPTAPIRSSSSTSARSTSCPRPGARRTARPSRRTTRRRRT